MKLEAIFLFEIKILLNNKTHPQVLGFELKIKNLIFKLIFKKTWLSVADNTNVRWLQIFQLYKGFHRKSTKVGFFVKGSARVVEPPRLEYKGFKFKFNKKGDICRGLFIRGRYLIRKDDGSSVYFKNNDTVLLKKKQDLKSKYLHGPVPYKIKRKKFLSLFKSVV